jgi:hypothetical protein
VLTFVVFSITGVVVVVVVVVVGKRGMGVSLYCSATIGCIHTEQLSQSPVGLGLVLGVKEKTKVT